MLRIRNLNDINDNNDSNDSKNHEMQRLGIRLHDTPSELVSSFFPKPFTFRVLLNHFPPVFLPNLLETMLGMAFVLNLRVHAVEDNYVMWVYANYRVYVNLLVLCRIMKQSLFFGPHERNLQCDLHTSYLLILTYWLEGFGILAYFRFALCVLT